MSDDVKTGVAIGTAGGPWGAFLKDYFSDIPSVFEAVHELSETAGTFDKRSPAVLFLTAPFHNQPLLSKLKVRKLTDPSFRAYLVGESPAGKGEGLFDGAFPGVPEAAFFKQRFVETLPLPETAQVLVVDDEQEIGAMVRDYFEGRKDPRFDVVHVPDGREFYGKL